MKTQNDFFHYSQEMEVEAIRHNKKIKKDSLAISVKKNGIFGLVLTHENEEVNKLNLYEGFDFGFTHINLFTENKFIESGYYTMRVILDRETALCYVKLIGTEGNESKSIPASIAMEPRVEKATCGFWKRDNGDGTTTYGLTCVVGNYIFSVKVTVPW